jgi:hypothetical protein
MAPASCSTEIAQPRRLRIAGRRSFVISIEILLLEESWHPVIRSGSMLDQGFGIVAAAVSPTGGFCWS